VYLSSFITPTGEIIVAVKLFIYILNEKLENIKTIASGDFFPEKSILAFDEGLAESKFLISFFYDKCELAKYKYKIL